MAQMVESLILNLIFQLSSSRRQRQPLILAMCVQEQVENLN